MIPEFLAQHSSVRKSLLGLSVIGGLALVFPSVSKIMFASEDEISFDRVIASSTCVGFIADAARSGDNCVTTYQLEVGNTGHNPQPLIEFRLRGMPEVWRLNSRAVDIVASAERRATPLVSHVLLGDELLVTVQNLEPNRLVAINLDVLGLAAYNQLDAVAVDVRANGTVIETSPHMTVVSRFLRNIFSVFGF